MRRSIGNPVYALAALAAGLFLFACGGSDPAPALAEHQHSHAVRTAPAPAPPMPTVLPAAAKRDFRAEAAKYIGYYNAYRLTPEQEKIKTDALSRMPAPCCDDNTMATCCCPCNMAKAVWGLSAHLIVEEGYDADRLEKTVRDWLADANPNGYSGDACSNGGCSRSFDKDGCGGMFEGYVF